MDMGNQVLLFRGTYRFTRVWPSHHLCHHGTIGHGDQKKRPSAPGRAWARHKTKPKGGALETAKPSGTAAPNGPRCELSNPRLYPGERVISIERKGNERKERKGKEEKDIEGKERQGKDVIVELAVR